MKDGNGILKYCSVLVLAILLATGALTLSGPDEGVGINGSGICLHQEQPANSLPDQVMGVAPV